MAQTLASVAVGTVVKLNENGSPVQFYVACQDYESGLNGAGRTLLVRKNNTVNTPWSNAQVNAYANSAIDTYLNGSYKSRLDSDIQTAIGNTTFYYTPGNGNTTVTQLTRSVLILSLTEFGFSDTYANIEGSALPIANTLKVSYYNGQPDNQWTRSPRINTSNRTYWINPQGVFQNSNYPTFAYGARPAFTLPGSTTYVLDDGTITLNQPPTAPVSITVPTVAAGQPCAITWEAATDPDGTIASYTLQRSVNGSGWTQVFSGNALTYTDTVGEDWGTVAYQVCAVDNYGAAGPFTTSETQTVQDGILYISGPAPTLGQQITPFTVSFTTGVSGDTSTVSTVLTVSLDGNQIYSGTVDTGTEVPLTIDTRVIGGGNHTIEASATAENYISASQSYSFATLSITLPTDGYGEQFQDSDGNVIFPQSVAALIAGLNGQSVAGNLQNVFSSVADLTENKVQVETGSYVGTGLYGISNQNTITFSWLPKAVFIIKDGGSGQQQGWTDAMYCYGMTTMSGTLANASGTSNNIVSWNGLSMSWYSDNATYQKNESSIKYYYIAIG